MLLFENTPNYYLLFYVSPLHYVPSLCIILRVSIDLHKVAPPANIHPCSNRTPPNDGTTAGRSNRWDCRGLTTEQIGSRNPVEEGSHK